MSPGYYQCSRKEMIQFLPQHYHTVLEIGCGEGTFSLHLNPHCETWGVEPNSEAASKASKHITHVLTGTIENNIDRIPDNYFDLIIANDVIEHLQDHDYFFERIKTKMTLGGYLVGSIPNVRYCEHLFNLVFKKEWNYTQTGILDKTHLRFFTGKSLRALFKKHGFIIEQMNGINKLTFTSWGLKRVIIYMSTYLLIGMTLGYFRDIALFQYGFRIKKNK